MELCGTTRRTSRYPPGPAMLLAGTCHLHSHQALLCGQSLVLFKGIHRYINPASAWPPCFLISQVMNRLLWWRWVASPVQESVFSPSQHHSSTPAHVQKPLSSTSRTWAAPGLWVEHKVESEWGWWRMGVGWGGGLPASAPGKGSKQSGGGWALLLAGVLMGSTQQGKVWGGGVWHFLHLQLHDFSSLGSAVFPAERQELEPWRSWWEEKMPHRWRRFWRGFYLRWQFKILCFAVNNAELSRRRQCPPPAACSWRVDADVESTAGEWAAAHFLAADLHIV